MAKSGWRKRRIPRPQEKDVPDGYDSGLEARIHQEVLDDAWIHVPTPDPDPIVYTVEHTYHTDFVRYETDPETGEEREILLEVKGRFWDYQEYNKYVWVAKALEPHQELVFLFAEPNAPMPGAKRRVDGTKFNHAEWAYKNGFRWFSEDSLPDEWRKEKEEEQ